MCRNPYANPKCPLYERHVSIAYGMSHVHAIWKPYDNNIWASHMPPFYIPWAKCPWDTYSNSIWSSYTMAYACHMAPTNSCLLGTCLNEALVRDAICIEYRIIQFDSPQKFPTLQWRQNFKNEQTTIGDQEILLALSELCITLYCSLLPLQMLDFKHFSDCLSSENSQQQSNINLLCTIADKFIFMKIAIPFTKTDA